MCKFCGIIRKDSRTSPLAMIARVTSCTEKARGRLKIRLNYDVPTVKRGSFSDGQVDVALLVERQKRFSRASILRRNVCTSKLHWVS
ncbi:hypothetical protein D918_04325 [Trichuris suis]|nr:hypothetical protein D918_04325 [Trichuris suis]